MTEPAADPGVVIGDDGLTRPGWAAVDPLLRAMMRAAGTDALPGLDLDALRHDPAAKRALWPRLRALRVAARTR